MSPASARGTQPRRPFHQPRRRSCVPDKDGGPGLSGRRDVCRSGEAFMPPASDASRTTMSAASLETRTTWDHRRMTSQPRGPQARVLAPAPVLQQLRDRRMLTGRMIHAGPAGGRPVGVSRMRINRKKATAGCPASTSQCSMDNAVSRRREGSPDVHGLALRRGHNHADTDHSPFLNGAGGTGAAFGQSCQATCLRRRAFPHDLRPPQRPEGH